MYKICGKTQKDAKRPLEKQKTRRETKKKKHIYKYKSSYFKREIVITNSK